MKMNTIQFDTTTPIVSAHQPSVAFSGLLSGLVAGPVQSWGRLEVVGLFRAHGHGRADRSRYNSPLEWLKLVRVPHYGTMVLHSTATEGLTIVPMHVGFFQEGAQNHATSRVLILAAGESFEADDCFCIQQAQGGLLKEAQQRFLVLPLGLRAAALQKRGKNDYSRLWGEIDGYTRRFGVARGGHLERFLRPYFARLMPFRHAFETVAGQVGAAYFVAGRPVGVELSPNAAVWRDLAPILNIYCYGPAALLAEQADYPIARPALDVDGLTGLDDLADRLDRSRRQHAVLRSEAIGALAGADWSCHDESVRHGLTIRTIGWGSWAGQVVLDGSQIDYLSIFRDLPSRKSATIEPDLSV
jgi:hypothetical protein